MVTIFDVAKEAGVSKSTVSRVINRDTKVKKETRDAVEAAIKKLNYSPSYMAQAIRTRRTHTIALVATWLWSVIRNVMQCRKSNTQINY